MAMARVMLTTAPFEAQYETAFAPALQAPARARVDDRAAALP